MRRPDVRAFLDMYVRPVVTGVAAMNSVVLMKAFYEACQPGGMANYTKDRCQCVAGLPAPSPTKAN